MLSDGFPSTFLSVFVEFALFRWHSHCTATRSTARLAFNDQHHLIQFSPSLPHDPAQSVNFDVFLLAPHLHMSNNKIVFDVTKLDGTVMQERVQRDATELRVRFSFFFFFRLVVASRVSRSPQLGCRQIVAVSDNIAQLTHVAKLWVRLFFFFFYVSLLLTPAPSALQQRLHRDPCGRVDHDAADVVERESPSPVRSLLTR